MSQGSQELADRLHSVSIHLLRTLRTEDRSSGLSPPRLSALSVLVFGGERTISELARAEQVTVPSMSRLIKDMESEGLVRRTSDKVDQRISRISSTPRGRRILEEGRARRVGRLHRALQGLSGPKRQKVREAAIILEALLGHGDL